MKNMLSNAWRREMKPPLGIKDSGAYCPHTALMPRRCNVRYWQIVLI